MLNFLKNNKKQISDRNEADMLIRKYGDEALEIIKQRAADKSLSKRDRIHWYRIESVIISRMKRNSTFNSQQTA